MICVYCQKMAVAMKLVEEYIKPEEMVILCVILAMSDFGNAEAAGCGSV